MDLVAEAAAVGLAAAVVVSITSRCLTVLLRVTTWAVVRPTCIRPCPMAIDTRPSLAMVSPLRVRRTHKSIEDNPDSAQDTSSQDTVTTTLPSSSRALLLNSSLLPRLALSIKHLAIRLNTCPTRQIVGGRAKYGCRRRL